MDGWVNERMHGGNDADCGSEVNSNCTGQYSDGDEGGATSRSGAQSFIRAMTRVVGVHQALTVAPRQISLPHRRQHACEPCPASLGWPLLLPPRPVDTLWLLFTSAIMSACMADAAECAHNKNVLQEKRFADVVLLLQGFGGEQSHKARTSTEETATAAQGQAVTQGGSRRTGGLACAEAKMKELECAALAGVSLQCV